jgi:hypothetical protein
LSNGIEIFSAHDIINRSYIIDFDLTQFGWAVSSNLFDEIAAHRNEVLSAEFMIVSKVLKRLKKGDGSSIVLELRKRHKGHSRERSNDYFALMIMIVEELRKAWGLSDNIWDLVDGWIKRQNAVAQETHSGSNVVLTALDMLHRKAEKQATAITPWAYDVAYRVTGSSVMFEGLASEFHTAFKAVVGSLGYNLQISWENECKIPL